MARKFTKDMLEMVIEGITLEKFAGVSPDADGKAAGNTKQVNVKVDFDGVTIGDVFRAALKPRVINWQNVQGRRDYVSLKAGQTVSLKFKGGTDPLSASLAKFKGMDKAAQQAYLKALQDAAAEPEVDETETEE
jgi:hypothetical protein